MGFKGLRNNLPLLASIPILIFYGIAFTGVVYEPLGSVTAKLVNKDGAFSLLKGETFIEWIEAIFWLFACTLYLTLFVLKVRSNKWDAMYSWFLFLALLCFVALGEETSWGQQLFGFDSADYIHQINKQRETNLHNLKLWYTLQYVLGSSQDSFIYPYLKYAKYLPQHGFYLVCAILWIAMDTNGLGPYPTKAMQTVPSPERHRHFCFNIIVMQFLIPCFLMLERSLNWFYHGPYICTDLLLSIGSQTVCDRRSGF
jgi:hypothetical protein